MKFHLADAEGAPQGLKIETQSGIILWDSCLTAGEDYDEDYDDDDYAASEQSDWADEEDEIDPEEMAELVARSGTSVFHRIAQPSSANATQRSTMHYESLSQMGADLLKG
mgnify:CR=1 FL=1